MPASRIGITALVPPEIIYGHGKVPVDLNNFIPSSNSIPCDKLCAWAAGWRDLAISGKVEIDSLVVVGGGDCHNSLVEGQRVEAASKRTHFLSYPFGPDRDAMKREIDSLSAFLGGQFDPSVAARVGAVKAVVKEIDRLRCDGKISPADAFSMMIASSDLGSDMDSFDERARAMVSSASKGGSKGKEARIALIGVPPVFSDFHSAALSCGLRIVFDEMPFEFVRLTGRTLDEIASSYCTYTFAQPVKDRAAFLKKELVGRDIRAVVHYTQYACHHVLEDGMLRDALGLPFLTLQGDLPGPVGQQAILRMEAFAEMLSR